MPGMDPTSSLRALRLLRVIRWAVLGEGGVVLLWLVMNQSEPQNAVFMGYSLTRLGLMAGVLGILLVVFLPARTRNQQIRLHCWLEKQLTRNWLAGALFALAASALPLGAWVIYQSTDVESRFHTTLSPLIPFSLWAILIAVQGLILLGAYPSQQLLEKTILPGWAERALQRMRRIWPLAMAIPGVVIAGFLIFLLFYGQPNSDEGWYLYASQMVYRGQMLYRDIAYTQMPLLPYIYGLPQAIFPSYIGGRLTSLALFLLTLGMACVVSRRFAGNTGVFWTLALFAGFTTGLYSGIVVKTYILTAFFMTGTIFWLTSPLQNRLRLPLAALFASCAALVRLSALGFALPILAYLFLISRGRIRWAILGVSIVSGLFSLLYILPNPEAAVWNLFRYHVEVNQSAGWDLFRERFANLGGMLLFHRYYYPPLFGVTCLLLIALGRGQPVGQKFWSLIAAVAGIAGFELANLAGGRFQTEYFIPGLLTLLPLLVTGALGLSRANPTLSLARGFAVLTLLAAAVISYWNEGLPYARGYLDNCGGCQPVTAIHRVGEAIHQNSQPDEQVLGMEYLFAVVDAGREVLPGLSMAQFSITDLPEQEARRYRVANWEMVKEMLLEDSPRLLLLSDKEQDHLIDDPIVRQYIQENYTLLIHESNFGQKASEVFLFKRK